MNIEGLSGREEQEAIKIVTEKVELIPEGTAESIINKVIWADKEEFYNPK